MLYEVITKKNSLSVYAVELCNEAEPEATILKISKSDKTKIENIRITSYNVCYTKLLRIKAFFARAEEELSMELTLNETTGKYESNVDDGLNLITGDYMLYLVGYYA